MKRLRIEIWTLYFWLGCLSLCFWSVFGFLFVPNHLCLRFFYLCFFFLVPLRIPLRVFMFLPLDFQFSFFLFFSTVCVSVFLLFSVPLEFLWVSDLFVQLSLSFLIYFCLTQFFYFCFYVLLGLWIRFLFTCSLALVVLFLIYEPLNHWPFSKNKKN